MKNIGVISILLLTLFGRCGLKSNESNMDKVDGKLYLEANCSGFVVASKNAEKVGKEIIVKIAGNKSIVLKDTLVEEESPDMIYYELLGELKNSSKVLINKTLLNYSQLVLIDYKSGGTQELLEAICFNNNGDFITSNYSSTDEIGKHQIYVKNKEGYEKIKDVKSKLLLDSPKWLDNQTIIFKSVLEQGDFYGFGIE